MCGRFVMFRSMDEYVHELDPQGDLFTEVNSTPISRYNIAPSTDIPVIHVEEGRPQIYSVHWGWKREVTWPKPKIVQPINARIETIAKGRFYKTLFPDHRALIPADGWYEWVKEPGDDKKQPFFIRLKSHKPMFFAGLAQIEQGESPEDTPGCLIITADAAGGMVDVHDRRPVVLDPDVAREWLSTDLSKERAKEIARDCGLAADFFEWFPVSKDVGNVKNKGAYLIESVT